MEFVFVTATEVFGELGEESSGDSDADERDRHLVQSSRLLEAAENAGAHARGEIGGDKGVNVIDALIERAGGEKLENAAEALVFPVDFKVVVEAEAEETDKAGDELQDGAESNTDGDAHDATFEDLPAEEVDAAGENCDAEEDADVVHGGSEGVEDEAADGLLHRGEDGGDGKEEGVDGNDAHHVDGEDGAGFVEARTDDVANERVGEDHDEDAADESNQGEKIEERAGEFPSGFFVAFHEAFVEDGDEGNGEGARSEDEEHEVGDGEGGSVGVDAGGVGFEVIRV